MIEDNIKLSNLVGHHFPIELGSSTELCIWDNDSLIKKIGDIITHNLFDSDFYYNWTTNKEEYFNKFNEIILTPLIQDIDNTLIKYFSFKKTPYSPNKSVLVFNTNNNHGFIDNWFKTNKTISYKLKKDYYIYRQKYANVFLEE